MTYIRLLTILHIVLLIGFIGSLFVIGSFFDWNGCPDGWDCVPAFLGPSTLLTPELTKVSVYLLISTLVTGELVIFALIKKIFSKEQGNG